MAASTPRPRKIRRRSTPTTICRNRHVPAEWPSSFETAALRPPQDEVQLRVRSHAKRGVSNTYRSRDGDVPSLRPLDFHINAGEFFVVVGPSGCGKSTLLKMISGLLAPSTGESFVARQQG